VLFADEAALAGQEVHVARHIWKGTISFGLVEIPVSLLSALQRDELRFTMLDRRNLAPVGYRRVNKKTGEEVPWSDIVKGYEHEEGQFVVLTDEDFERADPKATRTVAITSFADGAEIDPLLYDTPYYLAPQRKGSKGYVLLRETLRRSGKVGIATVVIRTREHLAVVFARGFALVLEILRFAHEIRPVDELDVPREEAGDLQVSRKESELADRLVSDLVEPFRPEKYRDEYRDRLLEFVRRKAEAGETAEVETNDRRSSAPARETTDLMAVLRESVAKARRGKRPERRPTRPRRPGRGPAASA
jgi:DNA end-binding protein Ku